MTSDRCLLVCAILLHSEKDDVRRRITALNQILTPVDRRTFALERLDEIQSTGRVSRVASLEVELLVVVTFAAMLW